MDGFSRPLVALSLTGPDEGLLEYAALLARLFHWRDVHFAHVVAPERHRKQWNPEPWRGQMEAEVRRFFGQPTAECRPSFHVVEGSRLDQIVGLAVDHERDLIVLGHRRNRSGRRSLANRLAMMAPASVWLVPEGAEVAITNILVPTDFSEHSADALSMSVGVARAAGLDRCQLLHVFFDPSTIRYDEHVGEVVGREQAACAAFVAGVNTQGIEVEPLLEESTHPAEAILRVAKRGAADLIVMNTRGRSHAASVLLGSTTSEVLTATDVPLLAVKHYGSELTLLKALLNHRIWEQKSPKSN